MKFATVSIYIFSLAILALLYYDDSLRYNYFPEISRHAIGWVIQGFLWIGGIIIILVLKRRKTNENSN
ncbi:MAG: hypothetical protein M0R51_11160 [Clostridia bacterium]|jgi:hypothetical protein|nr:hypothetical protein [Clostridia bacterium]